MKNLLYEKEYLLDISIVDLISQEIYDYLLAVYVKQSIKDGRKKALAICMKLEEALLSLIRCGNPDNRTCHISIRKKIASYFVLIETEGTRTNAFEPNEMDDYMIRLDAYAPDDLSEKYIHSSGKNTVLLSFTIKKHNPLRDACISIFLAVLFSCILQLFPGNIAESVNEIYIAPLLKTVLAVFSLTAMTMVFFNIMMGIGNLTSIRFVKRIGFTVMRYALFRELLITVVSTFVFVLTYRIINFDVSLSDHVLGELSSLFLDLIPKNIIDPFQTKNAMQIMILGAFVGIVLLLLGDKTPELKKLLSQMNHFSVKAASIVCKLVPFMIFLSISKLILDKNIQIIGTCWQLFLLQGGLCMLYSIVTFLHISRHTGIPIKDLIRNALPIMITGFSTASSSTCIYQNMELLTEKYGLDKEKFEIIQPIFQMLFEPTRAVSLVGYSLFACSLYGITLSAVQIILFVFVVLLSVVSSPPVNGGLLVVLSIVMTSIGLPEEAIELFIGVDALVAMVRVGFKQSYYAAEILMVSKKL